jgi:hypothetical protein
MPPGLFACADSSKLLWTRRIFLHSLRPTRESVTKYPIITQHKRTAYFRYTSLLSLSALTIRMMIQTQRKAMKTQEARIDQAAFLGLLRPSNSPRKEASRKYVPHFLQ